MIKEATEAVEGVGIGGINITDLRYMLMIRYLWTKEVNAEELDRLGENCKGYPMESGVEGTRVMLVNGKRWFGQDVGLVICFCGG